MQNDDLNSWLKVVAENKITTKNTWKSTLITHFKDMKQFKDLKGINFQKASCTLDGCIKVYSTRVDDVSEEATKLLDGFNIEDSKKKFFKKKDIKTIETNLSNINIKNTKLQIFRDSTFLSLEKKSENFLLLNTLNISNDGVLRMYSCNSQKEIKMCNLKIEKINLEGKILCPTFLKIGQFENLVEDNMEIENVNNIEINNEDFEYEEELEEINQQKPIFKKTEYSYFKQWAGPTHWKLRSKKNEKILSSEKKSEKFLINFMEEINEDLILQNGNSLIELSTIESRKNVNNNLPEDYNLEKEDLYHFNILNGTFNENKTTNLVEEDEQMYSLLNEPNVIIDEPVDEVITEIQQEDTKMPFIFRREQKKVDIKKLKNNILTDIKTNKNSKLSDICKNVPKMYDAKEKKDISIHFCIVSLLHVANEKNLELVQMGNDVIIKPN
ncbi:condensin complex subunit 2 (CND2) [Vairimorpha necatrix]|uniref:Condensin complex subunit 2 n=1 Tax=Vairimorpha necatrix TaxID=6039 RepID=A0AAX4JGA5_9MICR